MKTNISSAIVTMLTIGLIGFSGCSGGGSSDGSGDTSGDTSSVSSLTGSFVDSHVTGLGYRGTYMGTTDNHGLYLFKSGDTVVFSLGSITLGSLTGSTDPVSPLNFFDGATLSDQRVINIAVLLQSLDDDGDITERINILPATIAALEAYLVAHGENPATFDFSTLTSAELRTILVAVVGADRVVTEEEAIAHLTESLYGEQPPASDINGTVLACTENTVTATDAKDFNASDPIKRRVSSVLDSIGDDNSHKSTSHNTLVRFGFEVPGLSRDGNSTGTKVRPLILNYIQQIVGGYEMGDGSADIGDPEHVDGVYVALSLDDGLTWRDTLISDTTDKSSMNVVWNGVEIAYPGNAQKTEFAVAGNKILVAWSDKYCPSANPFDLVKADDTVDDESATYPTDYFAVNGTQKSIDYPLTDFQNPAPNGKMVYEVPFSCVWTARGIASEDNGSITWHMPKQLTTGARDSNHIWISGSDAGFAMSWQEDTEGLRSGDAAGPGDGWSGSTTNHGTDIWYSSIKMADFDATDGVDENTSRVKSLNNLHYPVRITDNETCSNDDTKIYCQNLCDTYGYETLTTEDGATITRCNTYDIDMLDNTKVVLNGDTGASRSALKLLKTDAGEDVVIFGYEETKGLSDNASPDDGTNIEVEGKSVYFESFSFDAIDDFNASDIATIQKVAMPLVSAGNIVNVKVPDMNDPSNMIYENARRLVIGNQIDSCDSQEENDLTFAFMYKQSFDTQGASSDMFVRVNNGFTYDSFVPLPAVNVAEDLVVTNVSAQEPQTVEIISNYSVTWTEDNLDDNTYDDPSDNTFSPRIFLRGNDIYTGYEYTPNATKTADEEMPNNFHTNIYMNGAWQGPVNVTQVTKDSGNTVDARFFSTPKGVFNGTTHTLDSDKSNPNVLFVTWGEMDYIDDANQDLGKTETDIFYKRALYDDVNGWVWDATTSKLAAKEGAITEEKEVGSFATPDGKTFYNSWIQETEEDSNSTADLAGVDSWFGRVDYNISIVAE